MRYEGAVGPFDIQNQKVLLYLKSEFALAEVGNLERAVARLFASGCGEQYGRDCGRVVLYEDAAKRRVLFMSSTLKGLKV